MKAWVFVEGPSEQKALTALWESWIKCLRAAGHGIQIVPLDGKARFFQRIGARAAEKLLASQHDVVVAMPDLYPMRQFYNTSHRHENVQRLRDHLAELLRSELKNRNAPVDAMMNRIHTSALKHDLEMLLLAANVQLGEYLHTDKLGYWREIVEDQDDDKPPKNVIQDLFLTRHPKKLKYSPTEHAPAILRRVHDIKTLLWTPNGRDKCPVFREMMDWLGFHFQVPAYQS